MTQFNKLAVVGSAHEVDRFLNESLGQVPVEPVAAGVKIDEYFDWGRDEVSNVWYWRPESDAALLDFSTDHEPPTPYLRSIASNHPTLTLELTYSSWERDQLLRTVRFEGSSEIAGYSLRSPMDFAEPEWESIRSGIDQISMSDVDDPDDVGISSPVKSPEVV